MAVAAILRAVAAVRASTTMPGIPGTVAVKWPVPGSVARFSGWRVNTARAKGLD
jgi:hypothetical protein